MLKNLFDRLSYAFIGFVLGSVVAAVLWYLYDAGFSHRRFAPEVHAGLANWIKYVGGGFAVVGFLFKDKVGSGIGSTAREVHAYETRQHSGAELPAWLVVPVLVAVAVGAWYLLKAAK